MAARMGMSRISATIACAAAAIAVGAGPAHAHAFGERYDLPLPLNLYLVGAAAAVVVSFIVIGLFVRDASWLRPYPRLDLLDYRLGRLASHPAAVFALKLVSVLLFALVVAAGLFGNQDPLRNLAPVTVWIVWWVGMAVVSAFVGDLWALINPWRTVYAWAEALWRRARPGRAFGLGLAYPRALGVWPAVALLLAFTWSELISSRPAAPFYIGSMALGYSALTWGGMFLFGRERWLRHGEVFSVVFGVLAQFAPMGAGGTNGRGWILRPFAVGLLHDEPAAVSMVAFVLLYIVGVIFDGVLATPGWAWLEAQAMPLLPIAVETSRTIVRTAGLLGLWLLCAGLYLLTCGAMAAFAGGRSTAGEIARRFVFTLVPIAIAYHLAHYLTYLLIQGQYAIRLISDPFGLNWNLLGTAAYRIDVGIVGARFSWYAAVAAIVTGHIVAVFLGHVGAIARFGARGPALRSQGPLTALMVVFTVASLSIMAEPIVQKARPASQPPSFAVAAVQVPADAVLPEAGTGRLLPVGEGKTAAAKLTYSAMASPYHDGTAMTAADLFYPFSAAYRWGARGSGLGDGYDPAIAAATSLMRGGLKGLKYLGADAASRTIRFGDLTYAREQLMAEVYLDTPATPAESALAPPWSPLPWHVIALMEEAVNRGWAAFSEAEAARRGVEWLDPVRSDVLKRRLKALVAEFERDGFVPAPLAGLATKADARERWKALAAFHAKTGHFLVTNGPYTAKGWAGGVAVLDVVRDPRYPLGVGSYDSYAIPRRAFVAKAEPGADGLVLAVEIDTIDRVMRDYKIVRRPLREAVASFGRKTIPQCDFVAVDGNGRVALAGQGRYRDDGAMLIDLKGRLAPGSYTVSVALYPNGNAVHAEIRRIPYEAQ